MEHLTHAVWTVRTTRAVWGYINRFRETQSQFHNSSWGVIKWTRMIWIKESWIFNSSYWIFNAMINITCAYTFDEQHIAIVYNCHKQYKWQVKWAHTMTLIVSLSQSEMPRWKSNQLSAKYVFINSATEKNCEDWGILPTSTTRSKCHSFQTEKKQNNRRRRKNFFV